MVIEGKRERRKYRRDFSKVLFSVSAQSDTGDGQIRTTSSR
jgi:hypothetical protein